MFTGVRSRFGFRGIAIAFTAAVALAIFPVELAAQPSPSVGVSATNALVGQTITVTVANGPGQVMDWVALYPVGGTNYSYTDWKYLNGLKTAPATGVAAATVTFTLPLTPGAFQVRFLGNNSFTLLATSATITSTTPPATVTVSPTPVVPGGPLTVVVANGPGNLKDWVGLFAIGSSDTAAASWKYVFGATGATLQFLAPATPGMYEARFFANDTYTRLATSGPFGVQSGPSLTLGNVSAPEGNSGTTAFIFTVTLSPTSSNTVTVDYATSNGTATAGGDYVAAAGTLTFPPGVATRSATVLVNGDTSAEPNETFLLTLSNPTNASIGGAPGVGAIGNDDAAPTPTITVSPPIAAPGGPITVVVANGPGNANDWVALSAQGSPETSSVAWRYLGGGTGATLTFTAPSTPGTYEARLFANDGYIRLATSNPLTVQPQQSSILSISDVSLAEEDSGTTPATFMVTLSPAATNTVTVSYATTNAGATAGGDFVAASGALTFAPGVTTQSISVVVNGDTLVEPDETFLVTLSSPTNAVLGDALGVGSIVNDDAASTLSVGAVSLAERDTGTTPATFMITLSPTTANTVTVNYATGNGSATAGVDYVAASGTLTFAPGIATRTVAVSINGDTIAEPDETFVLTLSNPTNAVLGVAQGNGSIVNDDAAPTPTITVSPSTVAPGGVLTVVAANGPGNATDWVALAAVGAPSTISVAWRYLGGGTGGTLTFTAPAIPGAYEARFFANDDFVQLATSSPFNVQPLPTLSINNLSLAERDSGATPATFTVTLAPTTTSTVTVNYATGNGTAAAGSDYTAASGTLTFAPGIATQTVSVSVTGDTIAEPDETFVVVLSNPVNAVLGDAQGAGTVLNDDAPPPPTVTVSPSTVAAGGVLTVVVANGPGNLKDWIALSVSGSPATSSVAWRYLGGGTGATLAFTAPSIPGPYEARFLANDEFILLATSSFTVTETTPPVITNVASSSITVSGATISWTTNEPSDTQVNYGLTTAYGSSTVLNGSLVTAHTAPVTGLTAGTTYRYRVRSRDAGGNLAISTDFTFTTLDGSAPTVAITAPAANATVSGTTTVSVTAADNVGVAGVQLRLDGAPLGAEDVTSPYAVSWNTTGASNGTHTLTAVARDAAGNQTTSGAVNVTVSNDTTPPVITLVSASAITSTGATITWTTNEASDTQVNYGLTSTYGSSTALNATDVTSHSIVVTGLTADTLYHYRVRSRDAAGNLALSGDFTFTTGADTTPPTVAMSAPGAGATVSGGAVTLAATASDAGGVAGVQFRVDGAALGGEDVTPPYAVVWNTAGSADLVFGVTKVIEWPMTMTAGSGFTKRLSVTCPGCAGEDMVTEDRVQTTGGSTAATWTFSAPAHYVAQMAAFKAAGTPAYVQGAVQSNQTVSGAIAQTFGASVAAGNLLVVAVAWQGGSTVSASDTRGNGYAVATQAYDATNDQSLAILYAANATAGATTVTVSFGGTPSIQRLQLHEYAGIAPTNPLDATASRSADGTTAANTITSGAAATTITAPVTNGSHTLTAVARDAAGNTTTSAVVTVTVNNGGDLTAPVITGVAVSAITSSGATFTWTTNEASDTEVEYGPTTAYGGFSTLDGARVTAHTMGVSGLTPNVLYHYRVRSRDAAGNLGLSGDFTFSTLEGTPPAVAITAPVPGAIVSGTIMVTANASDNVGVVGVQFRVDGAPLGAEDMAAPYAVSWNTATASAGSPVLTAVARDAASNQRTSSPVTVTVDTADVTLAWNANSEADLDGYKVHLGTAPRTYSTSVDVGNVTSYTVTGLQFGTLYYFAVTAYDTGGLESGVSNEVSATR